VSCRYEGCRAIWPTTERTRSRDSVEGVRCRLGGVSARGPARKRNGRRNDGKSKAARGGFAGGYAVPPANVMIAIMTIELASFSHCMPRRATIGQESACISHHRFERGQTARTGTVVSRRGDALSQRS